MPHTDLAETVRIPGAAVRGTCSRARFLLHSTTWQIAGSATLSLAMPNSRISIVTLRFVSSLTLLLLCGMPVATRQDTQPLAVEPLGAAAAQLPRLRSLLVSRHGRLAFEYYAKGAGPARVANVKSVSKSLISTLVGIAIDRRILGSVNEPLGRFFPEVTKDPDPRKARITVEDLLTMRSGLESTSFDGYGAWVRSRNWVTYVLNQPIVSEPGTTMEYSTGSTHLLSAMLTRATKLSTWAFLQESLGRPLGFTFSRWPRDPQGIYFGGNDMLMTPRQMVAFGELYLNRGRISDRQIVPASWIDASCTPRGRSRFNPDQRYGYGWWLRDFSGCQGCFAWGYGGQYIMIFRDLDLVVVTTSSTAASDERRDYRRQLFELVERLILAPVAARTAGVASCDPSTPSPETSTTAIADCEL